MAINKNQVVNQRGRIVGNLEQAIDAYLKEGKTRSTICVKNHDQREDFTGLQNILAKLYEDAGWIVHHILIKRFTQRDYTGEATPMWIVDFYLE